MQRQSRAWNTTAPNIGVQYRFGTVDQASASVAYGVFHVGADVALDDFSTGGTSFFAVNAQGGGTVGDTWVIGGGSGMGYLTFGWSVDGRVQTTGSGPGYSSDASLQVSVSSYARPAQGDAVHGEGFFTSYGGLGYYEIDRIPFFFDRPIDITFSAGASVGTGYNSQYTDPTFSGQAHADFMNTAILSAVRAYDVNGVEIPDITISAESGTQYPLVPSPVPEPTTTALMLLGLAALGARAVSRRRRGH